MSHCAYCHAGLAPQVGPGRRRLFCSTRCQNACAYKRNCQPRPRIVRPRKPMPLCACGQPRSGRATQCKTCYQAARRKCPFTCEWCRALFWRKSGRDSRRFCSKRCSGARRRAEASASRSVQGEIARALRDEQRRARACVVCGRALGAEGSNPYVKYHVTCRATVAAHRYERDKRELNARRRRARGLRWDIHVCPCCGQTFTTTYGDRRRVWCSRRCSHWMRKYRLALCHVPTQERNRLASLVALVKQAHRILYTRNPMIIKGMGA